MQALSDLLLPGVMPLDSPCLWEAQSSIAHQTRHLDLDRLLLDEPWRRHAWRVDSVWRHRLRPKIGSVLEVVLLLSNLLVGSLYCFCIFALLLALDHLILEVRSLLVEERPVVSLDVLLSAPHVGRVAVLVFLRISSWGIQHHLHVGYFFIITDGRDR